MAKDSHGPIECLDCLGGTIAKEPLHSICAKNFLWGMMKICT